MYRWVAAEAEVMVALGAQADRLPPRLQQYQTQ